MANLRAIRKRISSVKSTQQITRAMKMVSAAKLRRAQDGINAARPYARKMREVVTAVAGRAGSDAPLLLPGLGDPDPQGVPRGPRVRFTPPRGDDRERPGRGVPRR